MSVLYNLYRLWNFTSLSFCVCETILLYCTLWYIVEYEYVLRVMLMQDTHFYFGFVSADLGARPKILSQKDLFGPPPGRLRKWDNSFDLSDESLSEAPGNPHLTQGN